MEGGNEEYIPDPTPVRNAVPFRRAAAIFNIQLLSEMRRKAKGR